MIALCKKQYGIQFHIIDSKDYEITNAVNSHPVVKREPTRILKEFNAQIVATSAQAFIDGISSNV